MTVQTTHCATVGLSDRALKTRLDKPAVAQCRKVLGDYKKYC